MDVTAKQIRNYRLYAHHLDKKIPANKILDAAGACGLQNSPPGAWETALFNRLEGCSLQAMNDALCHKKTLLQAWSYRGVPVIFPLQESNVFLTPLIAQAEETPWIYTRGITGALDYLKMSFDDSLKLLEKAIVYLDSNTIKSKEALDKALAGIIFERLPEEKQILWNAPSMYGNPEKQVVGEAAVSFLLRPCSFKSLVVFAKRQGGSPTFTSFKNWTGATPVSIPDGEKKLVQKFLHCYGPATVDYFMNWLGCSPKQACRIWNTVADEITEVKLGEKKCYMLNEDMNLLTSAKNDENRLLLLGAHDPYLDLKDRTTILENKAMHKNVWKTVANPGVVLKGGQIIGIWKSKAVKNSMNMHILAWEAITDAGQVELKKLAEEYCAFRQLTLKNITLESM